MDVGLALPQFDFSVPGEDPLRWETVAGWARRAEELGFGSVWLADHLSFDVARYGGPPGQYACLDPLVGLAAVARLTTTVRLGTLVLSAPLRAPTVLAKALATIDVLSGGRLVVGLGAGNYEPDFDAAGVAFERPGARLERLAETVEVLRGMFGGGPFSYRGTAWTAVDARSLPRPVQRPHPPIWLGGRGDRLIELAARRAEGWNTVWTMTPGAYRDRLALVESALERAGRANGTFSLSLGLYALVGEDGPDLDRRFERLRSLTPTGVLDGTTLADWRSGRLVGTVEEVREQVAVWRDLGVGTLVVSVGATPFSIVAADDVALVAEACRL